MEAIGKRKRSIHKCLHWHRAFNLGTYTGLIPAAFYIYISPTGAILSFVLIQLALGWVAEHDLDWPEQWEDGCHHD